MNNDAMVSRVETEFSVTWIVANPKLFDRAYHDFFNIYGAYTITAEARPGFFTLVGEIVSKGD